MHTLVFREMRWFLTGPVSSEAWTWFDGLPGKNVKRAYPRQDIYLVIPDREDLGLKVREGRLEIKTDSQARMGQVVPTDLPTTEIVYQASGLLPGQRIQLIRDGRVSSVQPPDCDESDFQYRESLGPERPAFVRMQVVENGKTIAVSNPIYFTPPAPGDFEQDERRRSLRVPAR